MKDTPRSFCPPLALISALAVLSAASFSLPAEAAPTFSSKSTAVISIPAAPSSFPGGASGDELSFPEVLAEAENGDPEMEFLAGLGFDRGDRGYAEDPLQAAYWYERSAAGGNPMARAMLAYHYHTGYGRRPDRRRALILWRDALPGLVLEYKKGTSTLPSSSTSSITGTGTGGTPGAPCTAIPSPRRHYSDSIRRIPFPPRRYWPDGRRMPPRHRWDPPGITAILPSTTLRRKADRATIPLTTDLRRKVRGRTSRRRRPPSTGLRRNTERRNSARL